MTAASLEVRQLAEKLLSQKISATMAAAIQMAQSMLETSSKVMKDFNPRYDDGGDDPFTGRKDEEDEDKDKEDRGQEEEKAAPNASLLTLNELMTKNESHELKFVGSEVQYKAPEPTAIMPSPMTEPTPAEETSTPEKPAVQEIPAKPVAEETAPKNTSSAPKVDLYQKVDLTAVFGKH